MVGCGTGAAGASGTCVAEAALVLVAFAACACTQQIFDMRMYNLAPSMVFAQNGAALRLSTLHKKFIAVQFDSCTGFAMLLAGTHSMGHQKIR